MAGTRRYTIDLGDEYDELLTSLSNRLMVTKAEVVRRALTTFNFIHTEAKDGSRITVTGKDGDIKQVVML